MNSVLATMRLNLTSTNPHMELKPITLAAVIPDRKAKEKARAKEKVRSVRNLQIDVLENPRGEEGQAKTLTDAHVGRVKIEINLIAEANQMVISGAQRRAHVELLIQVVVLKLVQNQPRLMPQMHPSQRFLMTLSMLMIFVKFVRTKIVLVALLGDIEQEIQSVQQFVRDSMLNIRSGTMLWQKLKTCRLNLHMLNQPLPFHVEVMVSLSLVLALVRSIHLSLIALVLSLLLSLLVKLRSSLL